MIKYFGNVLSSRIVKILRNGVSSRIWRLDSEDHKKLFTLKDFVLHKFETRADLIPVHLLGSNEPKKGSTHTKWESFVKSRQRGICLQDTN